MRRHDHKLEELRIARLLAEGVQKLPPNTPCLTDEELDALAAGALQGERREQAVSHVASCDLCRQALIITTRLAAADSCQEPVQLHQKKQSYLVPLALAATVLLAIGIYNFVPKRGDLPLPVVPGSTPQQSQIACKEPPAQPSATGNAPVKQTKPPALLAFANTLVIPKKGSQLELPVPSANQAGFASTGRDEANRFHLGFSTIALYVACKSEDSDSIRKSAASLDERIQQLETAHPELTELHLKAMKLASTPSSLSVCTDLLEQTAACMEKLSPNDIYLLLGAWTASVRVAAQQQNAAQLHHPYLNEVANKVGKLEAPRGVAQKITEILKIIDGPVDEKSYRRMDELADDIQRRF
ncbi:hypothetical protein OR1_03508 [Geobacter sp. OR-1]|uniref:hypothetical protein n=1 Tax=Geobacter sp. OR-1 TaxID=1266765 RepID=UPI0005424B63|nr:hypothetical protein [Geobacter sp. OR-1]GAM11198.1 hypothetical protein OR1_03508 [Geobacter sp. OR-1]